MSSRRPHNIVNFGSLAAETGLPVWGTPANFNGFRDLAELLHGSQVVSVSQTLRQRVPPMLGRATITLGIGPHSGFFLNFSFSESRVIGFRIRVRVRISRIRVSVVV